jgi:hypothetical protein
MLCAFQGETAAQPPPLLLLLLLPPAAVRLCKA